MMRLKIILAACSSAAALPAAPPTWCSPAGAAPPRTRRPQPGPSPLPTATGINVLQDGPTDYGKIKAMVEAATSPGTWSTSRGDFAVAGGPRPACSSRSTSRSSTRSKLDPRFVTDHSVGSFYYSFVLGCNKEPSPEMPEELGRPVRHQEVSGQAHLLQMVGARRDRGRAAGRRRAAGQPLSAGSRPGVQEARHDQGRHRLVVRRRPVAAAARFRPRRPSAASGTAA